MARLTRLSPGTISCCPTASRSTAVPTSRSTGWTPDGVVWIRDLLRRLAGEGRTVFVSSHLMSEMALTADHLVVLGRGRLLADVSLAS